MVALVVSFHDGSAADARELATLLSNEGGGLAVRESELRWEPSGGVLSDWISGRWLLFLGSAPMAHLLDPCELANDHDYAAACRELDDLLRNEPLDAAGARAVELSVLIENYEARRDGYDLARMKRLLTQGG